MMRKLPFVGLLARKGRAIRSSEAGQALIFGALTLFMLAAFVMFTADSGMITSTRIEMQNAADECAYSGALYEANIISSIAYLNEAMAWMYYDALRYAVDTTITGTLNSLKLYRTYPPWNCKAPDDSIVYDDKDADPASLGGSAQSNYDEAYEKAKEYIPKIENTLNMFARWEWGMALACGELVDMEMNRVALKHNVEAMAIYPDVRLSQRNAYQIDLHIIRHKTGAVTTGWKVWTDDSRPPFFLEALKLGPGHWRIEDSKHDIYDIERVSPTVHHIMVSTANLNEDITVERVSDDHYKFDMIETRGGKSTTTHVEAKQLEGLGWAVSADDGTSSVKYTPFAQGGYWIDVKSPSGSGSAGVRRGPDGHMQQWTGSDWADVPGQADTVKVGGVNVQVSIDNKIDLDPDGDHLPSFTVPTHLQINADVGYDIPNVLQLPDITVVMRDDGVQIGANVGTPAGTLRFLVDDANMDKLNIYGLLGNTYVVPDSADAKWHANRDGTERDRLCPGYQTGNDFDPARFSNNEWTYQYRRGNPYFIKEVMERFAHHAICDRDEYFKSNGQYPRWAYSARYASDPESWYDVANGRPVSGKYSQTRKPWPGGGEPNYDSDKDGKADAVRIVALEGVDGTYGLTQDPTRTMDRFGPYYVSVSPWSAQGHNAAQQLVDLPGPIRLSEDFFYYGLTVACWRSAKQKMGSPVSLFRNPSWGVVAAASARAGFLEKVAHSPNDPPAGCDPQDPAPHFRFTWPTTTEIKDFVDSGYEDLYEPIWTAHLWPMTDAIKDEHLLAYKPNQTGLSYLFTGLLNANWFEPRPPNLMGEEPKRRDDVPVALRGMGLNPDDPRLNDVLEH